MSTMMASRVLSYSSRKVLVQCKTSSFLSPSRHQYFSILSTGRFYSSSRSRKEVDIRETLESSSKKSSIEEPAKASGRIGTIMYKSWPKNGETQKMKGIAGAEIPLPLSETQIRNFKHTEDTLGAKIFKDVVEENQRLLEWKARCEESDKRQQELINFYSKMTKRQHKILDKVVEVQKLDVKMQQKILDRIAELEKMVEKKFLSDSNEVKIITKSIVEEILSGQAEMKLKIDSMAEMQTMLEKTLLSNQAEVTALLADKMTREVKDLVQKLDIILGHQIEAKAEGHK